MSPQRREQRPCQRPRLLLMTSREGGPGEAHRRGTSVRSAQPSGLTTRTGSRRIPRERSGMTTLCGEGHSDMDCGTARGLPIVGNPEERTDETSGRITQPRGLTARRRHAPAEHLTTMAARTLRATSRFIPRGRTFLWACMRHVISRTSPARTTIPATGREPRRAMARSVPPPSDDTHGVPDGGALERDQLRLQSQPLLTPGAQGDGACAGRAL